MTFNVNDFLNRPILHSQDYSSHGTAYETQSKLQCSSILVFKFGDSLLGLKTSQISSVLQNSKISQIPFVTQRGLLGFVSYSGVAVPVLDLAAIFGLKTPNKSEKTVIFSNDELFTAFIPEQILGVENLNLVENKDQSSSLVLARAYYKELPISVIDTEHLLKVTLERHI